MVAPLFGPQGQPVGGPRNDNPPCPNCGKPLVNDLSCIAGLIARPGEPSSALAMDFWLPGLRCNDCTQARLQAAQNEESAPNVTPLNRHQRRHPNA